MLRILRRIIYGIRGRSVVVAARWRITLWISPNANSANTNMSRAYIHSEGLDNVKRKDSAEKEYLSLSFYHLIVLLVV